MSIAKFWMIWLMDYIILWLPDIVTLLYATPFFFKSVYCMHVETVHCPAATTWNHLELDVRMQSNWLSAYKFHVLGVAWYSGTAFDSIFVSVAPWCCGTATIWNDLELDVHMQSKWLCTNESLSTGVARHISTARDSIRLYISWQ